VGHGVWPRARPCWGAWALILDGDDYLIDSSYISRAMTLVQTDSTVDLVCANAYRRRDDIDGSLQKPNENENLPDLLDGKDLFLLFATEKLSLYHLTCLYKVPKARDRDFYRVNIVSPDWESLFRYILTGRVAFISDCVAAWRIQHSIDYSCRYYESAGQKLTVLLCLC
jgi:hypothetical protein